MYDKQIIPGRNVVRIVLINKWDELVIFNKLISRVVLYNMMYTILKGYYYDRANNPSCKYKRVKLKTIAYSLAVKCT